MEKRTKICVGVTACIVLLLSILALVCLFFLNKRDTTSNVVIEDLKQNLNRKGYTEIKETTTNKCDSGWEPLLDLNFPGTDNVCLCKHKTTGKSKLASLYKTGCYFAGSEYDCKKTKLPAAPMHHYRGKFLCAKLSGLSYEGYSQVQKNQNCPTNTKACGNSTSLKLCAPSSIRCPINSLLIQKADLTNTQSAHNYSKIGLDDGYNLFYSNELTGSPIITEFKAGYKGQCISPDEYIVPTQYEVSGLDQSMNNVTECKESLGAENAVDTRWTAEDNHSRLRIFNENGYFKDFESSSVLNTKDLDDGSHYLYSRGYSDWSRECTSDPKESLNTSLTGLTSTETGESKRNLVIAAVVILFVIILSAIIWLIYAFTKNARPAMIGCCWIWLCMLLIAAIVITCLIFYRAHKDRPTNSAAWKNKNCGDATTSGLLSNIIGQKSNIWKYALGAMILTILGWLTLCCTCCCFKKGNKNPEDDVMRSNRRSNYTELLEDDQPEFVPFGGNQGYPEMQGGNNIVFKKQAENEVHAAPPRVEYVEPERIVEYVQAEPTYVQAEPTVTTRYVTAEPTYVQAEPTYVQAEPTYVRAEPTYVRAEPTTTFVKADPRTSSFTPAPTTTYVNTEPKVTTTYVNAQPNTTTRYVTNDDYNQAPRIVKRITTSGREIVVQDDQNRF